MSRSHKGRNPYPPLIQLHKLLRLLRLHKSLKRNFTSSFKQVKSTMFFPQTLLVLSLPLVAIIECGPLINLELNVASDADVKLSINGQPRTISTPSGKQMVC